VINLTVTHKIRGVNICRVTSIFHFSLFTAFFFALFFKKSVVIGKEKKEAIDE